MQFVGVLGKVDGTVRIGGVCEAVHDVGDESRCLIYVVNFAVNSIGSNSIVNFAENYSERFAVAP